MPDSTVTPLRYSTARLLGREPTEAEQLAYLIRMTEALHEKLNEALEKLDVPAVS